MSNERRRIVRNVADDFVEAESNAHYANFDWSKWSKTGAAI